MKIALNQIFHFLTIPSLLILFGCGGVIGIDPAHYYTSEQMSFIQNISDRERTIATRICYAYQSKSSSFRGKNYNTGTFIHNISSKSCEDTRTNYTVNSIFKSSNTSNASMTLVPDTDKPFITTIQTDQLGYLTQLCEKIKSNRPISNTATEVTTKIQISFSKDTHDSYTIKYFLPVPSSNLMKIESMETFKVITKANAEKGEIQGMDESYSLFKTCETSDKYSEFVQKFSSFTK